MARVEAAFGVDLPDGFTDEDANEIEASVKASLGNRFTTEVVDAAAQVALRKHYPGAFDRT